MSINLIHTENGTSYIKNTLKCKSCGHEFSYGEGDLQNVIDKLQIKAQRILKEIYPPQFRLYEALYDIDFNWIKLLNALSSCCENPAYDYVDVSIENIPKPKLFVSFESMGLTGNENKDEIDIRVKELWKMGKLHIDIL